MPAASGVVTAPASFTATPDVQLGFEPDTMVFKVTSGTADISFDGVDAHLTLGSSDSAVPLPTKRRKIWVRQNAGAATLRWAALTLA